MGKLDFRVTLRTKIVGGFIAVLLLLAIVAWFSIVQVNQVDWAYSNLLERRALVIDNVHKLQTEVISQENELRALLLTGQMDHQENYLASIERYTQAFEQFAATAPNEAAKQQINDLQEVYDAYHALLEEIRIMQQTDRDRAIQVLNTPSFKETGQHFHEQVKGILDVANKVMATDQESAAQGTSLVNKLLISATLVAILLGLVISLYISQFISKAVVMVSQRMRQLANGDFSLKPILLKNKDEIGELVTSMNQMVEDLRGTLARVADSSQYLAASAEELSASSEQGTAAAEQVARMSQNNALGAEKQLHMFEQTAVKVEEINAGIEQIATSSDKMLEATVHTTDISQKGAGLINTVVAQMNEIHLSTEKTSHVIRSLEEHSQNITAIISLITAIAEQTNLLALNAAIEAARAGEHGHGFAVVADEIRKLAEESRQSAEQVIAMVNLIQQGTQEAVISMDNGSQLIADGLGHTEQAQQAFAAIDTSIQHVTLQVQEVSTALVELADLSKQIGLELADVRNISEEGLQLSQESSAATEEQLATTEEISSSVQDLASLAEKMQQDIARFKIT